MKRQLVDILRGMLMGIANVVPGLSGGTIAVILNVYERLINSFKDILKHPIKVIKEIWGLLIGIILGVVFGVFAIIKLIEVAPIPTSLLFVGLIIGAIPKIYQEIKGKRSVSCYVSFVIMTLVVAIIPFLPTREINVKFDLIQAIIFIALGIVAFGAMIIPGVSGSMVLMALGYYFYIWGSLRNGMSSLLHFDFEELFINIIPLIPFALGAIIGLVIISKLIAKLLKIYPKQVYSAIIGMLIISPFVVMYSVINDYPNAFNNHLLLSILIGSITLVCGYILAIYMEKLGQKYDKSKQELQDK